MFKFSHKFINQACDAYIKASVSMSSISSSKNYRYLNEPKNTKTNQKNTNKYLQPDLPNYKYLVDNRRLQAKRSIVVSFSEKNLLYSIYNSLSKLTQINSIFYFHNGKHCSALIEVKSESDLNRILENKIQHFDDDGLRTISRHLYFHGTVSQQDKNRSPFIERFLREENHMHEYTEKDYYKLYENLANDYQKNLVKQMQGFYEKIKLSEFSERIRFFVVSTIEDLMPAVYRKSKCLPFGSSMNGFGKFNSDLDMNMNIHGDFTTSENTDSSLNLRFMNKRMVINERDRAKRNLNMLYDILIRLSSFVTDINLIGNARVPIIKFNHKIINGYLKCDLSMSSSVTCYYMTKLLWTYSMINRDLTVLVYFIRQWAKETGITKSNPGHTITNYQLTLMILYFFISKGLMPALSDIVLKCENSGDNWNIVLKDLNELNADGVLNVPSFNMIDLLKEFFLFYSTFNFESTTISLDSKVRLKENKSALKLENPLQRDMNAAKNVSKKRILHFQDTCKETIQYISSKTNINEFFQNLQKHSVQINDDEEDKTIVNEQANDDVEALADIMNQNMFMK